MMGKRKKHLSVKKSPSATNGEASEAALEGAPVYVVATTDVEQGGAATPSPATAADSGAVMRVVASEAPLSSGDKPKRTRARGGNTPRWTEEEEKELLALRDELGERAWTQIAERLAVNRPHRSASGVEQHWQIMAGKRRRSLPSGVPVPSGGVDGVAHAPATPNSQPAAGAQPVWEVHPAVPVTTIIGAAEGSDAPPPAPPPEPPPPPAPPPAAPPAEMEQASTPPLVTQTPPLFAAPGPLDMPPSEVQEVGGDSQLPP